jgi:hypothetical protein
MDLLEEALSIVKGAAGTRQENFLVLSSLRPRLARVLLDGDPVVHFIYAQNLGFPAVRTKFVIFAHDEGLDRLGGTDFGTEPAEAAPRQIEIKVVQNLDFLAGLAMAAERNQVVRAGLRTLIAHDANLRTGFGLNLEPQDAPEPGRHRPALCRILKGEGRLRGVLERHPQALQDIEEEYAT